MAEGVRNAGEKGLGGGKVLMLEDIHDKSWTLVSSMSAAMKVSGHHHRQADEDEVDAVVDLAKVERSLSAAPGLGRSASPLTPVALGMIFDCTQRLERLRDEKARCWTALDNSLQIALDQTTATTLTMKDLVEVRSDADPTIQTIESQIISDLRCQLGLDREALLTKASCLRRWSEKLRSLEAEASAQESQLANLLRQSGLLASG